MIKTTGQVGGLTTAVLLRTTRPKIRSNKLVSVHSWESLTKHGGYLGERLFGLAGHESVGVGAEVPLPSVEVDGHLRLALRGSVSHDL